MELKITQNIKPEDLMQGISWHGETVHDIEAVEKLKELNGFVSDLVAKVFLLRLQMEQVATEQNNASAKMIADEAEKLLVNVAKMTTEDENWGKVEQVLQEQKYIAENIAQFKNWSEAEIGILREVWKELKKTGGEEVELKLDELKEKVASDKDNEEWEEILGAFSYKMIRLYYLNNFSERFKGISPFRSVRNDPQRNRLLVEAIGESFQLSNGVQKRFALDFLNEVMTKL